MGNHAATYPGVYRTGPDDLPCSDYDEHNLICFFNGLWTGAIQSEKPVEKLWDSFIPFSYMVSGTYGVFAIFSPSGKRLCGF